MWHCQALHGRCGRPSPLRAPARPEQPELAGCRHGNVHCSCSCPRPCPASDQRARAGATGLAGGLLGPAPRAHPALVLCACPASRNSKPRARPRRARRPWPGPRPLREGRPGAPWEGEGPSRSRAAATVRDGVRSPAGGAGECVRGVLLGGAGGVAREFKPAPRYSGPPRPLSPGAWATHARCGVWRCLGLGAVYPRVLPRCLPIRPPACCCSHPFQCPSAGLPARAAWYCAWPHLQFTGGPYGCLL